MTGIPNARAVPSVPKEDSFNAALSSENGVDEGAVEDDSRRVNVVVGETGAARDVEAAKRAIKTMAVEASIMVTKTKERGNEWSGEWVIVCKPSKNTN